jgi:hypothetical protein
MLVPDSVPAGKAVDQISGSIGDGLEEVFLHMIGEIQTNDE